MVLDSDEKVEDDIIKLAWKLRKKFDRRCKYVCKCKSPLTTHLLLPRTNGIETQISNYTTKKYTENCVYTVLDDRNISKDTMAKDKMETNVDISSPSSSKKKKKKHRKSEKDFDIDLTPKVEILSPSSSKKKTKKHHNSEKDLEVCLTTKVELNSSLDENIFSSKKKKMKKLDSDHKDLDLSVNDLTQNEHQSEQGILISRKRKVRSELQFIHNDEVGSIEDASQNDCGISLSVEKIKKEKVTSNHASPDVVISQAPNEKNNEINTSKQIKTVTNIHSPVKKSKSSKTNSVPELNLQDESDDANTQNTHKRKKKHRSKRKSVRLVSSDIDDEDSDKSEEETNVPETQPKSSR